MRKSMLLVIAFGAAMSLGAQEKPGKTLYVYDEANKNSTPYIGYFQSAFSEAGIPYDEATATELKGRDVSAYDRVVIHGMVMAFASKSPVRDWLKSDPNLQGKKVSLLVTANRWKLDKLNDKLIELLERDGAIVVDAVSMATKDMNDGSKSAVVRELVGKLK